MGEYESKGDVRSLVIMDIQGRVIDLGEMNEKAHNKTLENKVLWIVNTETGRVLPYGNEEDEETRIDRIETAPFGYMVYLVTGGTGSSGKNGGKNSVPESYGEVSTDRKTGGRDGVNRAEVLYRLAKVIGDRHEKMPEGSYTTHLFSSGSDKIRKKLGEEAVEVILARETGDIVYESADLIYHLLVLLEAVDISIDDVLTELESRE